MGITDTTSDGFSISISNRNPSRGEIITITLDHSTEATFKGVLVATLVDGIGAGEFLDADSLPQNLGPHTAVYGP